MNTAILCFSRSRKYTVRSSAPWNKPLLRLTVVCFIFTLINKALYPGGLWGTWDPVNLRLRSGYTHLGRSDVSPTHFSWVHQSGAEEKLQICRRCTTQRRRLRRPTERHVSSLRGLTTVRDFHRGQKQRRGDGFSGSNSQRELYAHRNQPSRRRNVRRDLLARGATFSRQVLPTQNNPNSQTPAHSSALRLNTKHIL